MTWAAHPGTYERLARRFHAGVYSYLCWLCSDADLAQDLTQATFVQVWRHPPEFRGERALRAWVYRVARNEYLQHQRRPSLETIALDESTEASAVEPPRFDPQLRLERQELVRAVRGALGRLPDTYREVIVLHNLEGFSLEQVASVLGIPKGTVKSRRAKGFALLRGLLAEEVICDEMQPSATDAS